jgi:hypothetical protein
VRTEIGYGDKVSQRLWSKKLEEGIDRATRHNSKERSKERGVFELERVVSCRNAQLWWRTKLNFGSGESFGPFLSPVSFSLAFRFSPAYGPLGSLYACSPWTPSANNDGRTLIADAI